VEKISVNDLGYRGFVKTRTIGTVREILDHFTHEFAFGKSYLLDAQVGYGAWALSWIIGGMINQIDGEVTKNGNPYTQKERAHESWLFHESEIRRFGLFRNQSVRFQIRHGLKQNRNHKSLSEKEVMERFRLTPARYDRALWQLSEESLNASCAIGFVNGKKVFCFPHMSYTCLDNFFDEGYHARLKRQIDLLKNSGALVLVPALGAPVAIDLCDEIVPIGRTRQEY
jgi:hypothetical protein